MKILLYALILVPTFSHAGVIGFLGPSGFGGYESDAIASNGKKSIDAKGTLGYGLGLELPMLGNFLSFNLGIYYGKNEAKSQYHDKAANLQIDDQLSYTSQNGAQMGLKIRPVNFKYWKIFAGAGGTFGFTKLRHDEADYIEKHGALPSNFKAKENIKNWGHYLEAGAEVIFSKSSGLRFQGQLMNVRTDRYETLNKKPINATYPIFSIMYIHYFDKLLPKRK